MFLNTDYQHKQQCTCHGAIDQLYGVSVVVYDKTSMSEFMQYSLLTLFTNLIRVHGWRRLVGMITRNNKKDHDASQRKYCYQSYDFPRNKHVLE